MSESKTLRSSSAKWAVPLCSGLALAAAAAYAVYAMNLYEPLLGRWGALCVAVAAGLAAGIAAGGYARLMFVPKQTKTLN